MDEQSQNEVLDILADVAITVEKKGKGANAKAVLGEVACEVIGKRFAGRNDYQEAYGFLLIRGEELHADRAKRIAEALGTS